MTEFHLIIRDADDRDDTWHLYRGDALLVSVPLTDEDDPAFCPLRRILGALDACCPDP